MSYQEGHAEQFGQARGLAGVIDRPDAYYLERAHDFDLLPVLRRATQLYIEFGPGLRPDINERTYQDGAVYLGVQHGSHDNEDPQLWGITVPAAALMVIENRQHVAETRPGEDINFMLADALRLPGLLDKSAAEVRMSNVVGNGMNSNMVSRLLLKANMLLGPDGSVHIRETITPYDLELLRLQLGWTGLREVEAAGNQKDGYELRAVRDDL